jgi:hypothetical protein
VKQQQRQDRFLSKAKEADETAAKAKSPTEREAWLKIAESYRLLAKST